MGRSFLCIMLIYLYLIIPIPLFSYIHNLYFQALSYLSFMGHSIVCRMLIFSLFDNYCTLTSLYTTHTLKPLRISPYSYFLYDSWGQFTLITISIITVPRCSYTHNLHSQDFIHISHSYFHFASWGQFILPDT